MSIKLYYLKEWLGDHGNDGLTRGIFLSLELARKYASEIMDKADNPNYISLWEVDSDKLFINWEDAFCKKIDLNLMEVSLK